MKTMSKEDDILEGMMRYLEDQFQSWASKEKNSSSSDRTPLTYQGDMMMNSSSCTAYKFANKQCFERNSSQEENHVSISSEKKMMNKKKRVIKKGGLTSVTYKNISKKRRRYISDLYTTLLDSSWSYCVLMFTASFYLSWLLFALFYYIISYIHGDLNEENQKNDSWKSCILEVDGFSSSFLFSLETQHTIGYGTRQTTTECPEAMLLVSLQSVLGCLIQAFMVGLVFSKLSRPQLRTKTVIFSHHAVITLRNKKLCLIFRIGDLRDDNFILGTQISAKLLRQKSTLEGEVSQEMEMLNITPDTTSEPCLFFVWPLEIVHTIDEGSPLYDISAADLVKEKFELLVIMEGTIETSSMTFQARSSYLPNEILWGHRFESMVLYRKDHNKFQVNFSAFNSTYEVETPICSAREIDKYYTETRRDPAMHLLKNLKNNHLFGVSSIENRMPNISSQTDPGLMDFNLKSSLLSHEYRSDSVSSRKPLLNQVSLNSSSFNSPKPRPKVLLEGTANSESESESDEMLEIRPAEAV